MDPFTLALVLGGGYLGATKVWPKIRERLHHAPVPHVNGALPVASTLPMTLDAGLSDLEKLEIGNLLQNVPNATLLSQAAALYQAKNFPVAAQVLSARAKSLGG